MNLYDRGRTLVADQESVGHELFHYLFGLRDEYPESSDPATLAKSQMTYSLKSRPDVVEFATKVLEERGKGGVITTQTTQDEQRLINEHGGTKFDYRQFCSAPSYRSPDSCVMDGSTPLVAIEYYDKLCSDSDHSAGVFTVDNQSQIAVWSRNGQSVRHGKNCRSTAEEVLKATYGRTVDLSVSRIAGIRPDPEFEEKDDCSEVVVLLLDKSGSMSGAPLANLKSAVITLIDLLSDDVKLGIVWFDSQPQAAVGIQKLGESRELAKQAVTPISASGGTRIGFGLGVAYEQIVLLRDPEKPRGKEIIFLVTDGVSSDDTSIVVDTIANDGVKINPIALGQDVDTFGLFEMAERTGGRSFVARGNEDINKIVVQGTAESLENYFVLSDRPSAPLTPSIPIEVDSYVGRLLIQLNLTGIDPTVIQQDQFSFRTESGASTSLLVRFEALGPDSASVVVEIDTPQAGVNTLELPPGLSTQISEASVLVFGQSTQLHWRAALASSQDAFAYPEPVIIQAAVSSVLGSAHGMIVNAIVIRPDGSEIPLSLFDDGSPIHGDEISNDGLYSAKFLNFNGNGTYQVKVIGEATEATLAGAGEHTIASIDTETFEPFSREQSFSFEVVDFEAPQDSTVTVEKLSTPLDEQEVNTAVTGSTGVILGGFKVSIGPGQGVRFKKLRLEPSGEEEDIKSFERFALYVDSDSDGLVDFVGPTSQPQSIAVASLSDGTIVLDDILELEGDTEVDILLVGLYEKQEEVTVVESGFPFLLLPLVLTALFFRKKGRLAILMFLCLLGVGSGCGDRDSFVFTNETTPTTTTTSPVEAREFKANIRLDGLEAVGRITGDPIDVQVIGDSLLEGPMVNIR